LSAEPGQRIAELELQVEELRRVNRQLGGELVGGGGSKQPRSPVAAARALAKLTSERDSAQAELDETQRRLAAANASFEGLRFEAERLRAETERLRSGTLGLLRRLRVRLLRR
jgi:chromosome segregation ATPase